MPRGQGLKKLVIHPDQKLGEVVGHEDITALELTQKVWEYVNTHGLKEKIETPQPKTEEV